MARDARLEQRLKAIPGLEVVGGLLEGRYYRQDQGEIPAMLESLFVKPPSAIVRPTQDGALERLASFCAQRALPLVPRGAASYPLGGTLPVRGGVILDLSLDRKVVAVDATAGTATVDAGTRWDDLDRHLTGMGLALQSYPTSRFSTIAGWVATGGYGVGSVRYGHFASQVTALDVVTPEQSMRRLLPGDTLFESMFGTEGQVGVIRRVTLKVRPRPEGAYPVLLYADDSQAAIEAAQALLGEGIDPYHLLYMDARRLALQNRLIGADHFHHRHALLAIAESRPTEQRLLHWAGTRVGLTVAPRYHATLLWHDRFFPLKAKRLGPGMLAAEVVLPMAQAPAFFEEARRTAEAFGAHTDAEAYFIGGDRVLAITPFLVDPADTYRYAIQLGLVALLTRKGVAMGGRPYGLGFWNQGFAPEVFGERLARLRDLKRRVDPACVLNPGKSLSGARADLASIVLGPMNKLGMGIFQTVMPWVGRLLPQPPVERSRRDVDSPAPVLAQSRAACSRCGACVTVCPAYLATRDEMVTARGKLFAAMEIARGRVPSDEARRMFLCMHCSACEEVCQSELPLMECWDRLEEHVEHSHGRPVEAIEAFVKDVENQPDYQAWIDANVQARSNVVRRGAGAATRGGERRG